MFSVKHLFAVLTACLTILASASAAGQADCIAVKMHHSADSVTIGELRRQCRDEPAGNGSLQQAGMNVVSRRIEEDRAHVLEPFTLMSHRPNYFLVAAHNTVGYDASLYRQQFDDPSMEFDNTEAQFQLSIKTPLAIDVFNRLDVYAGYTNRSFWQVYNSKISSPFRETNHEPEVWAQFHPYWKLPGFTNTVNAIGLVHQSNGKGGALSRSWNRIFASFIFERGGFALLFKPWYRLPEDSEEDDNPDITDYMGHYSLRGGWKSGHNVISIMSRNNLESGFSKGAVELSWSFPIPDYPYLKGYVQLFSGYGESLIDYDNYTNSIGIGVALTDYM